MISAPMVWNKGMRNLRD